MGMIIIINVIAVSVVGKKTNKVSYCRKFPSFVAVFHRDDDDDNNDDDGDNDDVNV